MAKRVIYFIHNSEMYQKEIEVPWSESTLENRILCSDEIYNATPKQYRPSIDVSGLAVFSWSKELCVKNLCNRDGETVYEQWNKLNSSIELKYCPPGAHELLYLTSLGEDNIFFIRSIKSFHDLYFNPDKHIATAAKALVAGQMLLNQNKIDYLYDMHKFLHWFYFNCAFPEYWKD